MGLRDRLPGRAQPAHGRGDRAVRGTPAQHQGAGRSCRVVDLQVRDVDAVDLGLAGADHEVVVGRVVGDVAGAVLLLDAADAVLESRRAGHRPGAGQGLRVALVRPEDLGAVVQRRGSGPVANCTRRSGSSSDARGSATARSRWPGSRRRAGTPACGRSARSGPPPARRRSSRPGCAAPRSAPGPRRCARTSPGAGRPARSWSAARWTGRRAGCR